VIVLVAAVVLPTIILLILPDSEGKVAASGEQVESAISELDEW